MSKVVVLACVFLGIALAARTFERTEYYHGEQVWTCGRVSQAAYQTLLDEFDVWHVSDDSLDIRVRPHQMKQLMMLAPNCTVVVDDLEKLVADHQADLAAVPTKNTTSFLGDHTVYRNYADVHAFYADLNRANPSPRTSWNPNFGTTVQNRGIGLFIINGDGPISRSVVIQCQIHAREWISGAVCQYLAEYWLTNLAAPGTNPVKTALQGIRVNIIPILNGDGYVWTWTNSRLWRKNRRQANCIGVDLNRNYRITWNQGGSSTDPCSDTYMGPSAASEPETLTSQRALSSLGVGSQGGVDGAVDMHSYSQLILRPYGFTQTNSPDEAAHNQLGAALRTNILAGGYNTAFTNQKSIQLYVTSGTFEAHAYGSASVGARPLSCLGQTIELRPVGANPGFQLPPAQIIPSGIELQNAFNTWFTYFQTRSVDNNCGR